MKSFVCDFLMLFLLIIFAIGVIFVPIVVTVFFGPLPGMLSFAALTSLFIVTVDGLYKL